MHRTVPAVMATAATLILTLASASLAEAQPTGVAIPPPAAPQPFDQKKAIADLTAAIAGKEELPAGEVFKNIQQYKGVTAARLVRIMDYGFTRSLGVDCTHCHVANQWEVDEKVTKQIAREMSKMLGAINADYLKKIPNLRSTNPSVNCTTCHRGQTRPALELPEARPANPGGRSGRR